MISVFDRVKNIVGKRENSGYPFDSNEISQKWSWHGLLQKLFKEFDSSQTSGCHGNKIEKFWKSFKISVSDIIWLRVTKFGM